MDASDLLAALPEDPSELAKFIQDRIWGTMLIVLSIVPQGLVEV